MVACSGDGCTVRVKVAPEVALFSGRLRVAAGLARCAAETVDL